MWFCYDDDEERIIALHDNKEVVEKYCELLKEYHNVNLSIGKIKKKAENRIKNLDDLYLVRYGDTYVQSGYLLYLQMSSAQLIEDISKTKDVLLRILELDDLSKKEIKSMERTVMCLTRIYDEQAKYTPTVKELSEIKNDFDPYFYNTGIYV